MEVEVSNVSPPEQPALSDWDSEVIRQVIQVLSMYIHQRYAGILEGGVEGDFRADEADSFESFSS